MRKLFFEKRRRGATLVEVLVAIALTGIMMPTLLVALITANSARPTSEQNLSANSLLNEAIEATRSARENSWNSFAVDGTFHPILSGTGWALSSGPETINGFIRQVVIADTERGSSGNIVASGGTPDPSTKLITVSVSWNTPTPSSVSSQLYLTHWQHETSWLQTTQADFNSDTLVNTTATTTGGGQVQLIAGKTSGTVESITFDALNTVDFNQFVFTISKPALTNITLQIATNNDNATWNYVGPNGTAGTSYSATGPIPLSAVTGRYFRYKATLTGTATRTPALRDARITYSKDS